MKALKINGTFLFAISFIFGLVGCVPKEMTRKEVIDAVRECEDAGMEAKLYVNWNSAIKKINCLPVKKKVN